MEIWILFAKINVCLVVFALGYQLLFRRLTFHRYNRLYLVCTLFLSFGIPLSEIEIVRPATGDPAWVSEADSPEHIIRVPATGEADLAHEFALEGDAPADWPVIIGSVYAIVSCVLLMRLIYVIITVTRSAKKGELVDGFRIVQPNGTFRNCSFFNVLFLDRHETFPGNSGILVAHEKEHARRFHSLDKLLIEVTRCLLWANPAVYFYRYVIDEVHEFEVDESATRKFEKREYASFLVAMSVGSNLPALNGLSSGSLKSRVQMLFTKPSHKMKKSLYVLAAPLIGGLIALFTVKVVYAGTLSEVKAFGDRETSVISSPASRKAAVRNATEGGASNGREKQTVLTPAASVKTGEAIAGSTDVAASPEITAVPLTAPEKPLRIILDPGHGGKDHGGKAFGIKEKDIILETALRLKNILEEKGVVVQLTRKDDEFVALRDRASKDSGGADMLISVHMQMAKQDKPETNGIQIFYSNLQEDEKTRQKSLSLANSMYEKLAQRKELVVRENLNVGLMVLRASEIPAVLLELGFMTNKGDLSAVKDDRYLAKIADVIKEAGTGLMK